MTLYGKLVIITLNYRMSFDRSLMAISI